MNTYQAGSGLVKVMESRKEGGPVSAHLNDYLKVASSFMKKGKGVYTEDSEVLESHKRHIEYSNSESFDAEAVIAKSKKTEKPFKSIVEYVFNSTAVNLYVETLNLMTKVQINHVHTPAQEKKVAEEAKVMTEKLLLNRVVGVTFQRTDDHGNLVGRIHHKQGDIAEVLLEAGLAKTTMPKTSEDYDQEYYKHLRDTQNLATIKKVGLWHNMSPDKQSKSKTYEKGTKSFQARITEINSGDSVSFLKEGAKEDKKVFFASIKAPILGRKNQDNEPWAWEAIEFVRKAIIGKKVKIEMEYKREFEIKDGPNKGTTREMEFATIFHNGKNISVQLLEKGFANLRLSKYAEENSKHFEDLIKAEKKSIGQKVGLHNKKPARQYKYIDTSINTKAAKTIERNLMQSGQLDAVVDYCFSGQKYKLRIDSENVIIGFGLQGAKCPQPDKNSKEITAISNTAKDYATGQLHQRDVKIVVRHMDKKGNFYGQLWNNSGLFTTSLLQKGFAYLDAHENDHIPEYGELEEAETTARGDSKGVWRHDVALELGLETGGEGDEEECFEGPIKAEVVEMSDPQCFYVRYSQDLKKLGKIESQLSTIESTGEILNHPVKVASMCAVMNTEDDKWYRARIERNEGEGMYQVFFVDTGNYQTISSENTLKLPTELLSYNDLANPCKLAFTRLPKANQPFGDEAFEMLSSAVLGKETMVNILEEDNECYHVAITPLGKTDPEDSINVKLLNEGLAACTRKVPVEYKTWEGHAMEAKLSLLKIWEHGGGIDDDEY